MSLKDLSLEDVLVILLVVDGESSAAGAICPNEEVDIAAKFGECFIGDSKKSARILATLISPQDSPLRNQLYQAGKHGIIPNLPQQPILHIPDGRLSTIDIHPFSSPAGVDPNLRSLGPDDV